MVSKRNRAFGFPLARLSRTVLQRRVAQNRVRSCAERQWLLSNPEVEVKLGPYRIFFLSVENNRIWKFEFGHAENTKDGINTDG